MIRTRKTIASTLAVLGLVACGSSDPPSLLGGRGGGESETENAGGGGGENGNSLGNDDRTPTPPEAQACATATATAEALPLHMVVVLDKSGSMCEYTQYENPRDCSFSFSKWQQVTKSLISFFANPKSKGITVSLIAFPVSNGTCNASAYVKPLMADVTLPDTKNVLANQIFNLTGDGATPTRPALQGALAWAKAVETKLAGKGRVSVVMATDGYPQECDSNSIGDASKIAAASKATIPTYVIGVGNALSNLNQLAAAGGTSKAFLVSTSTSDKIGQDFADALTKIRTDSVACEYALPAPAAGQTIDPTQVNVRYAAAGAAAETIKQSTDCSVAAGWRYDDAAAPTKIQLCTGACDRAKADGSAKVDIVLGCKTEAADVR